MPANSSAAECLRYHYRTIAGTPLSIDGPAGHTKLDLLRVLRFAADIYKDMEARIRKRRVDLSIRVSHFGDGSMTSVHLPHRLGRSDAWNNWF